ncbi:NYN domain-containing protein [Achromobacter sp. UMC71]|uniref:NYN domain-containing protein n=1 Tax=Achromobacter sp. UMC71 TaxID=1862320 RepID=UPI001603488F|nr:NYN domain-containing protein [Achromobacter sp. UMC71]MBB1624215.1 hypothetical protein [Achromobacter sp. UMC71]
MNANENVSMALFCDFENVALGVRDTKYQKFDIRPVLERLLLKGSIVVKKAYCDWERYKEFKAPMHEANFELIEIPHVRQSGKNSADIRLVVDALDFCYTKSHVNTFVIISGDSDFSPLVSKLRENNKKVIGVGVKQSTSDLLIANCDEFIFYDDLAREGQRAADARRDNRGAANTAQRRSPDEERRRKEELEARKTQAVDMVVETFEALMAERGDSGKVWASALKDALKRRRPDFNESYYGFRAFGNLLDEAQSRGFLEVGREEKSGTYVYRDSAGAAPARAGGKPALRAMASTAQGHDGQADAGGANDETEARPGRNARGGRKHPDASGGRGGRAGAGRNAGRNESGRDGDESAALPLWGEEPAAETAQPFEPAQSALQVADALPGDAASSAPDATPPAEGKNRRGSRGGRGAAKSARNAAAPAGEPGDAHGAPSQAAAARSEAAQPEAAQSGAAQATDSDPVARSTTFAESDASRTEGEPAESASPSSATGRKPRAAKSGRRTSAASAKQADAPAPQAAAEAKPARKTATRARRPRKAADAE